ncbi:MAG: aldehyde dehydrogenase [Candidatus Marinimicrobia bacterium]|nr:aldehyde dehydrogenase [Candidatus Neomarinimicrobiota bacterium]
MTAYKNFVNNDWVDAKSGETFPVENPATEETFAEVPRSKGEDIELAVRAAQDAFGQWRLTSAGKRRSILRKIAAKSRDHRDEIANLITEECGKPLVEAEDEISVIASNFEYYAELGRDQIGRIVAPTSSRSMSLVKYEPYGVVGCIIPWNFPMALMAWKVAPALAAGNTIVLKPSEITPVSILKWVELTCNNLPAGVLNIVTGYGKEAGTPLVEHPDVPVIAFTGSVATGTHISQLAAKRLKKVSLELGGKDPIIVCGDCDVEVAAKGAAWGGFMNAGQVCTSVERVYVFDSVADSFTEALVEEAKQVNIGHPRDSRTDIGPMASSMQYDKALEKVNLAVEQGARLLTGGCRPKKFDKGYFYAPTVFDGMTSDMELMNEETFSPVVPIQRVKSLQEAIELSNATKYGLGCSIYTKDIELAMTAADDIKAGSFWINNPLSENNAAPFGGMKMSGQGRELGIEGLDEFRESKHILIDYRQEKKDWWFPYGENGD